MRVLGPDDEGIAAVRRGGPREQVPIVYGVLRPKPAGWNAGQDCRSGRDAQSAGIALMMKTQRRGPVTGRLRR